MPAALVIIIYRTFTSLYKVTISLVKNLLLTSKQKFLFGLAWTVLAWPVQNGTFVLKSTRGFEQVELSPCRLYGNDPVVT